VERRIYTQTSKLKISHMIEKTKTVNEDTKRTQKCTVVLHIILSAVTAVCWEDGPVNFCVRTNVGNRTDISYINLLKPSGNFTYNQV
jgi:hypothetical protein